MCKLITTSKSGNGLSFGFDNDGQRRQGEMFGNTTIRGKSLARNQLKDVFGLVDQQPYAACGLGYAFKKKKVMFRN